MRSSVRLEQLADVGFVVDDQHGLALWFRIMASLPALTAPAQIGELRARGRLDVIERRIVGLADFARDIQAQPGAAARW